MLDSQCSESERIAQLHEPAFLDSQRIAQMTAMTGCEKKKSSSGVSICTCVLKQVN
jgi:hypothetical protein